MNFLIFTTSLLILATLQAHLSTLWWFGGLRIEFLPALVVYGSLTLRRGAALRLALATGFTQDALSAAPFGLTTLVYGIAATVLTSMGEALDRDQPGVQLGAGALTGAAVSFAACCVVGFSIGAIVKLLLLAAISAAVTPLLFLALDYTRHLVRAS